MDRRTNFLQSLQVNLRALMLLSIFVGCQSYPHKSGNMIRKENTANVKETKAKERNKLYIERLITAAKQKIKDYEYWEAKSFLDEVFIIDPYHIEANELMLVVSRYICMR